MRIETKKEEKRDNCVKNIGENSKVQIELKEIKKKTFYYIEQLTNV